MDLFYYSLGVKIVQFSEFDSELILGFFGIDVNKNVCGFG
jgi:hypothetical protein